MMLPDNKVKRILKIISMSKSIRGDKTREENVAAAEIAKEADQVISYANQDGKYFKRLL